MAQRLSHKFFLPVLALVILLLSAIRTDAQSPGQPPPPSLNGGTAPKPPEPPAAAKELSAQEVDGLIEKAFGKGSVELRRPIRMWIPDIGMVIAAEKASVARDGRSVRFTSVSIGILNSPDNPAEDKVFRGDETVVTVNQPVAQWSELKARIVAAVEIHDKISIIALTTGQTTAAPIGSAVTETVIFAPAVQNPTPLPPSGGKVKEARRSMEIRFKFKIDPQAPLGELLPALPKTSAKLPLWTNEDLAKVPDLTFGEPISNMLPKHKAMETTAHVMAKINHLNAKKRDGFMLAMIENRPDLRGLPFLMGDECRTRESDAKVFAHLAHMMRRGTDGIGGLQEATLAGRVDLAQTPQDQWYRATVAAASQIFLAESKETRLALAKNLAGIPHIDATKALAKLAIFLPEDDVRYAAIEGLKTRREKDYTDILMQGFRYPLPAVSKRAAEALIKLERNDLLVNLVEVLESPDPRLPVTEKRDGKDVTFVREMVKVNHHRNCLLCHAPGNTENVPDGVLTVAVPLPTEPLPKPSQGGYQSTPPLSPDIVVRLDMTYLRQDFSLMMPVSDAHPWPEMQRFDFLVRTRTLTAQEAQAYEPCCEGEEPGRLSPYHRSALYALRELTGRDTEPTAAAWRKLLKFPARNN